MPEYVDKEKAIDLFYSIDPENDGSDGCTTALVSDDYTSEEIEEMLSLLPAADVAPVVHGKWEYEPETINTYAVLKCSECGWWTLDLSIDRAYHYCPNCGARCDR